MGENLKQPLAHLRISSFFLKDAKMTENHIPSVSVSYARNGASTKANELELAELYDPQAMPAKLHTAYARNDETLERIYIGRQFKNDTERLEKLFELYTKMAAATSAVKRRKDGRTT